MVQSQGRNILTIGAMAKAGGVGVETIRYYQRRGLLPTPDKDGGIRRYGLSELRRLKFIRKAQGAGFTLEEIGELLELDAGRDRTRARQLALGRIEALDQRIAELQSVRSDLAKLATECSKADKGPCPILDSFGV